MFVTLRALQARLGCRPEESDRDTIALYAHTLACNGRRDVPSQHSQHQDSDSITQSELMRIMNDNSKDEEIQAVNYSSYIPTESVHGPRHVQDMWSVCVK